MFLVSDRFKKITDRQCNTICREAQVLYRFVLNKILPTNVLGLYLIRVLYL